ncbi:class I SAM-dependent methyltransferase [Streptomyces niveus]|uniref:class I SAM-dependent methyltransferase n=1 Tax=Streptomyces niveus TaxID=193462 RepID=UPI003404E560
MNDSSGGEDGNNASVARFYDQLAADYHLIYDHWDGSTERQGRALDTVIRSVLGQQPATVLDCACGIGTQAVGLALRGHRVTGTDISTRPYDQIRRSRPVSTTPQLHGSGAGRTVTFQLWDWSEDGERYDLEHFQLIPSGDEAGDGAGDDWRVEVRRTTYRALTERQLAALVTDAGFDGPAWRQPEDSGFFQPLLTARRHAAP